MNYEIRTNDSLEHHGILGQKWGVRRYQNKDGSLKEAGKKRYLKDMAKDQDDYFKKRISKEASKVTKLGRNGQEQRGNAWNDAYRKGKVNSKDDAQVKKAAKETREYMVNKYGKDAVKALSQSGVLGRKISDFEIKTSTKSFVNNSLNEYMDKKLSTYGKGEKTKIYTSDSELAKEMLSNYDMSDPFAEEAIKELRKIEESNRRRA